MLAGLGLALAGPAVAAETNRLDAAMEAFRKGRSVEALRIADLGLKEDPKNTRLLNAKAQIHQLTGDYDEAEKDLTAAIRLESDSGWLYQERAQIRFRLGRVESSVADFDRAVELTPKLGPLNWQRGIALYYVGRFADARKQFELHRTVNPDDVENAAWHFLCAAREQGIEKARAGLMPIRGDTRVPMAQIHDLFAGKIRSKEVLDAADDGPATAATPVEKPAAAATPEEIDARLARSLRIRNQRFYAYFYLALYSEAKGDAEGAEENIRMSLFFSDPANYMGVVAKVHADRLAAKRASKPEAKP